MEIKDIFKNLNTKKYNEYKSECFFDIIDFKKDDLKKEDFNINCLLEEIDISNVKKRIWVLFGAENDNKNWECLQVAQSKNNLIKEIEEVLTFMKEDYVSKINAIPQNKIKEINSAFYKNVYKIDSNCKDKRIYCYSKISSEYKNFKLCTINAEKVIDLNKSIIKQDDIKNIIDIAMYQYVEAKIAFETKAKYWNMYKSGVDGQSIMLFLNKLKLI